MPRTYEDGFRDALLTFRHQWSGPVNNALHIIHHVVYRCSPGHPSRTAPVLAASSITSCTCAPLVIRHIMYWCSPRHVMECDSRNAGSYRKPAVNDVSSVMSLYLSPIN